MGVNNRKRRANKRRKHTRDARRRASNGHDYDAPGSHGEVESAFLASAHLVRGRCRDLATARASAESLLRRVWPIPTYVVAEVAGQVSARLVASVRAGGWGEDDLVQLISRCGGEVHVPALLAALHDGARLGPSSIEELTSVLVVTAVLIEAPLLRADSLAPESDASQAHPKLAQARALLAKAESTEFPDEAEALTAKAQQLIARYSLSELDPRSSGSSSMTGMASRRIWLDPPYVGAKSCLVHRVGDANHVRSAASERHGFCVVVGAAHDLDAVELLVTSLLVQADRAMLAHGSQADRYGTSRTRSFRQSFLFAFANRVGQRLAEAGAAVLADEPGRFLPVVRSHDERVKATFDALVPHTTGRSRSASNLEGWAAGVVAADLAQLGVRSALHGTA